MTIIIGREYRGKFTDDLVVVTYANSAIVQFTSCGVNCIATAKDFRNLYRLASDDQTPNWRGF